MSYKSRLDALVAQTDDEEEKKSAGGNYIDRLDSLVESSSGSASQSSQNSQSYYDKTKDRYLQEDITSTPKVTAKAPSFSASADLDAAFESIQKSSAATQSMYNDLTGRRNAVDKLTGMLDAQSANLEILARNPSTFTDDTQLASYIDEYKKYETYTNLYNSAIEQYNDLLSDYNSRVEQYQTDIDAFKKMSGNGMNYANDYNARADQLEAEADELLSQTGDVLQGLYDVTLNSGSDNSAFAITELQNAAQQKRDEAAALRRKAQFATGAFYDSYTVADDFKTKSKAVGGKKDNIYNFINDLDGARENTKQMSLHEATEYGDLQPYSYMTDDEIATYNYIYEKSGKKDADEYLRYIQDMLSVRQGSEIYGNLTGVEKGLYWIPRGIDQWLSGTRQLFHSDALPTSPVQFAGQSVRDEIKNTVGLSEEDIKHNYEINRAVFNGEMTEEEAAGQLRTSKWGTILAGAYDFGTVVTNMLPSILVGQAIGGMLSSAVSAGAISAGTAAKIASATGSLTLGASAGGNAYQQKLKEGWTKEQAKTYATLVGSSEALLTYFLGGIDQLAGKTAANAAEKAAGNAVKETLSERIVSKLLTQIYKLDNAYVRFALELGAKLGVRGSSEAIEESLQELLEPVFANIIHGDEIHIDVGNVAYAGLMGFLAAGFFDVSGIVKDMRAPRSLTTVHLNANTQGYMGNSGIDWYEGCNTLEELKARRNELWKQYDIQLGKNTEIAQEINNQYDMQKGFLDGKKAAEKYTGPIYAEETQRETTETAQEVQQDENRIDLKTAKEAEQMQQTKATPAEQIAPAKQVTEEVAPAEENALQLPGGEEIQTEGGNINVESERAEPAAVEPGESVQPAAEQSVQPELGQTENAVGAPVQVPSGGRGGEPDVTGRSGTGEVREDAWRISGRSPEHKQIVRDRQFKAAAQMPMSAADKGIHNGSQNAWLRDYTEDMWDDDAEARNTYKQAEADGVKLSYVLGPIEIESTPGKITRVNAQVTPTGEMIIRADAPNASISELYDHERLHWLVRQGGPELVDNFATAAKANHSDNWQQVYDAYENKYAKPTNNYAGMSPAEKDRYVWEEVMGDAYSGMDNYGQPTSSYQTEARDAVRGLDASAEPQVATTETTIPTGTETETPEARGPPEGPDTNTTVGRVEKFSLDPDTIDYAMQYTCRDENTKNQLDLLKNSLTAVASVQDAIYKEVGGRATQNIHTINDYLAAHPDAWQQLWNIQQNLIDAGVRCEFVTAPGTANEIDGVEVAGGLIGLPIEYVPSTTGKRVKFSAFWRQMPQMMLDSMTHDSRERLRTEIVKGVEDAYRRRVGETDLLPYFAEQFPTAAEVKKVAGPVSAKNISNRTMPKVQAPLRSAEKTVMALNLNSACPMFTIGNNGCYLDACYLTQMANGAPGTNLFRSAWYTGEILQVSDSDIELMNKLGGLRINGVGDTTMDNKSQLMDVIRHAGMRGLKLKMITKQRATLEVLAELYRSGVDVSHVTVQPSMDTLWIPAELDDIYGAGVRGTTQLADTVRAGNLDAAASGYEEMFGRATKIEDGVLYRKYGFSPEQIREMKDDFPFVQITPRYVVCTAAEIAEIALNRNGDYVNGGKVIQTLMHGKVPEGCTSDYPGELLNFGGARHVVSRVDGQWKFYGEFIGKDGKVGKIVDGPNTPYGKVMAYVEANYTPQEQNKIWSTLRNQMCCQANDFKDACAGCQSLCARGCAASSCEDFDYRKYTQKEKEAAMSGENDVRYAVDEDEEPSDAQSGNISKTTPRERTQAEITTKYQDDVDKVLAGTYGSKDALILGYTPKIYTDMGMPSIPFVIGPGHVYSAVKTADEAKSDGRPTKGINYHGLGDVAVKNIYSALEDPIMIIASKDIDPNAKTLRSTHSVVAIIDVGTNNISRLLPVEITAERMVNSENMDVNVLSSAYDKDTIGLIKEAFAQENTGNIGVFYAKKEAMNLIRDGLQLPKPVQVAMTSDGIVHYFHEKVNMKIADATQSQQFTRWFGDWQNDPTHASKVVDEDGKPLVVYHGTEAQFDAFDASKTRSNMDIQGSFFSPWEIDAGGYGENVGAYYLNLRNPAPESVAYRALNRFKGQNDAGKKARDYLINLGYDGVNNGGEEYIAFYPEQIKSATDNIGTFDKKNPKYRYAVDDEIDAAVDATFIEDINRQFAEERAAERRAELEQNRDSFAPTFYSKLQREVANFKGNKIGASSAVSYLKGHGVKDEEIKWSGINTFLEGKKSVDKQELLDWLKGNELQIEEETLGSVATDYEGKETDLERADQIFFEVFGEEMPPYIYNTENPGDRLSEEVEDRYYGQYGYDEELHELEDIINRLGGTETKWSAYKLDGGRNYREILFKIPGSDYSNNAMGVHWDGRTGVLAHARIQDMESNGFPVLFIDEIQSDWHNAGQKNGYQSDYDTQFEKISGKISELSDKYNEVNRKIYNGATMSTLDRILDKASAAFSKTHDITMNSSSVYSAFLDTRFGKYKEDLLSTLDEKERRFVEDHVRDLDDQQRYEEQISQLQRDLRELNAGGLASDAPYAKNYHEFVLKNLLRQAAENGDAYLAWTPGRMQAQRWSSEYAEGYRIEYDQDIPKFLNKYGKQWGAKVTEITLDGNGETVPAIEITAAMRDSVLYEGQPRFSVEDENQEYQNFINNIENDAENLQTRENPEERQLNLKRATDQFRTHQSEREATGPIGLQLPTTETNERRNNNLRNIVPEDYENMDAFERAVESRAAAAQAERLRTISKEDFVGTPALDKIGVKIEGSVGIYSNTDELLRADREAKKMQRQIQKAEQRLGVTEAEKNFAAGLAAGLYTESDIPASMDADAVEELADYYFAGTNAAKERLYQQKHQIEQALDEKMETLFKDSDDYKPSRALTLNYRTPERNMLHIFGDKQGELINQAIFYPEAVNESERFRFVNRMHDEVRKFENKDGRQRKLNKNERALTQMVIEGRAAAETVAGMEMHEAIENAATNILNGADPADAFQEFQLGAEEQKVAVQYARWLQTQQMLDSGKYDTVKIDNAVKKYQELFGEFYDAINDFLVAHGYEPIGFIKGYAPHMQPEGSQTLLNKVFNQLGINTDVTRLPTSIAGLTANFKPNKRWNPYFLQRTGTETEYDIASAFESYVDFMSDVLYHTDDTMRVRAAARYFRRTYAPEEIKNNLSYAQELRYGTPEQKANFLRMQGELGLGSALTPAEIGEAMDAYVERLLEEGSKTTKYSDLVMWLDNYANILAGKQSMADRSAESMFGRTVLNVGNRLTRAFAHANVAGSLSSMLNQMAQLPMIYAELGDRWAAAAIKDIVTGRIRKGEWMSQSDFLVGKAGIDYLVSTPGEMALSIMFKPAELMDTFVATVAVRGKYLKEIHNGKSHKEAMKAADRFGTSVMGSRMKGSKPVAFHSKNPLYQMVNVFQIEAFNSWEHIKEDLPRDFRRIEEQQGKGKATWTLASILVKGLLLAFLGNRLADKLYGGTPMPFDLIGLTANFIASGQGLTTNDYLMQLIDNACEKLGIDRIFDTEPKESEDFDWGAAVEDTGFNVMNDVPFLRNVSGLLGLGDQTLPMPDLYGGGKSIWQTFTAEDADRYDKARSILEFMSQFMPGGRQIKKSVLGAETVLRGGDFSGRGENRKLKYPIDGDTWTDIQAILFGKYATEASNEYYAAGNSPLSIKQTKLWQTMVDAGADPQDIYNAILDYRALSKDEEMDSYERGVEQRDLLRNLDVSDDLKLQMYRELTSADSRSDKFEKIMDAGLSFDRVMDIYDKYAEIDQDDDAKAQAKANEFAKWLDTQKLSDKQKSTIRDQLKYYSIIPAEASRYDKLTGAGLEPEDAYKLTETLSSLAPEEGADGVSNMQQYRAIAASNLGENEKISAIGTVMGTDMYTESGKPSQYAKMLALTNYGLSIDQYLDLHEADVVDGYIRCLNAGEYDIQPETYIYYVNSLPDFDADGNGNYTQAEMTAAVSAIPDIDSDQRAVLWQISHKNWKPNNNPWSYSVGASVYDAINGETDELLGLELPS